MANADERFFHGEWSFSTSEGQVTSTASPLTLRFVLSVPIILAGLAILLARYDGISSLRRRPRVGHG